MRPGSAARRQSSRAARREHMSLVRQPLVSYESRHRARFAPATEDRSQTRRGARGGGQGRHMSPAVTRRRSAARAAGRRVSNKVRLVKGRVKLRVPGYPSVQTLSPSHLVRHISAAKLRLAAKQVLKKTKKKRVRRRRKTKRRKGKRSKKKKKAKRRRRKRKQQ